MKVKGQQVGFYVFMHIFNLRIKKSDHKHSKLGKILKAFTL